MTSDDDYDFTSTGGNYYQPSRWKAPQPLELPAVDWQSRWREERDRAEKAEAERDAATQWQPIETAPRDGTWLLGAFGASGLCIFRRHDVGGRYEAWVTHEGAACKAPQYWMPLPANPWRAKP